MSVFVVFCASSTAIDAVKIVTERGHRIDLLVGLETSNYDNDNVSGLVDVSKIAEKYNINYYKARSYSLSDKRDKDFFLGLEISLIWVAGWQRLLPKWLLEQCRYGALGGHGSPDGINLGRGRSPQNWALIMGLKEFKIALFKLTPGIDDGPVIDEKAFAYNSFDDIATSYKKVSLCMGEMVSKYLEKPKYEQETTFQSSNAKYFPQRTIGDGAIDWNCKAEEIYNFVRALSKPYPMARSMNGDSTVKFNALRPFDDKVSEAGVISFVFDDNSFLINCSDGRLIVDLYDAPEKWRPEINGKFSSFSKKDNLTGIIARHMEKFPNMDISDRLKNFLADTE